MPLVELIEVTKRFGGLVALDGVSLELFSGEVHALVGENGAGKSTLINLLSGVLVPDAGIIRFRGDRAVFPSPIAARRQGIVTVHQEVEVFPPLSLAENLALAFGLPRRGPGIVDWSKIQTDARAAIGTLKIPIDPRTPVARLRIAERQMSRIAAALAHQASVLLLDEPTSSLSDSESRWLFDHIGKLRAAGTAIVYISHRTAEVFELADRITVLRDGRRVWTGQKQDTSPEQVIQAMVGRPCQRAIRRSAPGGDSAAVRLRVERLSDAAGRFQDVSLDVRAGEIVGLYGLIGAGRSEFAQAVFGLRPVRAGSVRVDDRPLETQNPAAAIAAGVAYVPEDRLTEALFHDLTIRTNACISSLDRLGRGPLSALAAERSAAAKQVESFDIRCRSVEQSVRELSGGNQQKVVLSRWLLTDPKVLILDEPTRGIDVGAKAEIHRWLHDWVSGGRAALLISSDLPEILEHADRVLVLREGRVAGEFGPSAGAEQIARAALPDESLSRPSDERPRYRAGRRPAILAELGLMVAIVALGAILALTSERFWTSDNLIALLTNTSVWSILALGSAVVIISGGIDISIGAVLALAAAAAAMLLKTALPPAVSIPLAITGALATGALAGAANAGIALAGGVHPIVVTLATMTAFRGLLILVTGGDAITDLPRAFDRLATDSFSGVNGSIVTMLVVIGAVHFWLKLTVWGREIYALGASPAAARMVGISRNRVWPMAFALGGALSAVAGLLELAQSGSMQSSLGSGYELRAIAAAVIGGAAITGGRGTALGVFSGALLISLVHNALVLWQVSRYHSDLVIGGLILSAVLWDLAWRKLDSR